VQAEIVETRLGKLTVESGYPSKESMAKLIDEMDYQRACQAYVWGLPIVGVTEWQKSREAVSKVRNGQFELFLSFDEKLGIMTPNFDTPYFIATADLEKSGPLVIEMPKGLIAGMVMDAWQRSLSDLGVVGPDKGEGGKYLILGPGQEDPKAEGAGARPFLHGDAQAAGHREGQALCTHRPTEENPDRRRRDGPVDGQGQYLHQAV
jgi:hypothetical protein